MTINANGKALLTATRELSLKWDETKHFWQDGQSLEFERKFLIELFASVDKAVEVFDQLDKLVTKVRADCE
jgi:hypothetical protein